METGVILPFRTQEGKRLRTYRAKPRGGAVKRG